MLRNTIKLVLLVSSILITTSLLLDYIRGITEDAIVLTKLQNSDSHNIYESAYLATTVTTSSTTSTIDINNPPKIAFYENSYNFGFVKKGQYVEHKFRFKNIGKGDLHCKKPTGGGWHCNKALLDANSKEIEEAIYREDKSGTIIIKFTIENNPGDKLSKVFNMETNDPKNRNVEFSVSGVVIK